MKTDSVVETIEVMLQEWGTKYEQMEKWGAVDFVLREDPRDFTINARDTTGIVKIRTRLPFPPDVLAEKRGRLLEACNIMNAVYFLKAALDPEGVQFSYEIPAHSITKGLQYVVANVLHYYRTEIDEELFRLAVETDEDLYRYFAEKQEREIAELK